MQLRCSCLLHLTAVQLYSQMVCVKKSVIKNVVSILLRKKLHDSLRINVSSLFICWLGSPPDT